MRQACLITFVAMHKKLPDYSYCNCDQRAGTTSLLENWIDIEITGLFFKMRARSGKFPLTECPTMNTKNSGEWLCIHNVVSENAAGWVAISLHVKGGQIC